MAMGLQLEIISANRIRLSIEWVIRNMGVCFVPAGVGIMEYLTLLERFGAVLLIFTIVSSFMLLFLVGALYQKLTIHSDIKGSSNE